MGVQARISGVTAALAAALFLASCQGLGRQPLQLSVSTSGTGTGTITSNPDGINCSGSCSATFPPGSKVTLTATPSTGFTFTGWSGACTGTSTCTVTLNTVSSVTAMFSATLQSINHIIVLAQENRSFDSYF